MNLFIHIQFHIKFVYVLDALFECGSVDCFVFSQHVVAKIPKNENNYFMLVLRERGRESESILIFT